RSWNGGLSKTLMMKERMMKKMEVVMKYEELGDLNNGKDVIEWQSMVWIEEDAKDGLAKQGSTSLRL
ncbi:hypothetical protein Tco_1578986, partial [Tanacetum coccineum]